MWSTSDSIRRALTPGPSGRRKPSRNRSGSSARYLPLKSGGRLAKQAGWGSSLLPRNRNSPHADSPPLRGRESKRPRMPMQAKARAQRPAARKKGAAKSRAARLPLSGIRVVEFTHMVMGPTCGMILGDLGAEVIKVEPPGGDKTRRLLGSGAGFFRMFNRNKKSVSANLDDPADRARIDRLIASADVVSENFRPGALKKYRLDYALLRKKHKRLIYVSHKGFLPGPYEHRVALDEVVQMMA